MAITPLNFWVQPVIPLTFDDSISYLETLGKVVEKLNESLTQNEDWAAALRKDITDFTAKIENEMTAFKTETNADISSFENRISAQISTFKQQMNDKYSTFKNEIQTLVNSISLNPDYSIDHDSLNMWDVWGSGAKLNYKLNNITGAEVYSNGHYISAYIPVRPLKKYAIGFGKPSGPHVIDDSQYIIVYDKNKNFVSQLISDDSPTTFEIPVNGYYIRINVTFNTKIPPTISITNLTEDTGMVDIETLPVVNGYPDYSWFDAPESFKTTISSTTTDDNAVYKRKITWRDMDDSKNLALYDNVTVGGYTTGAYDVTTGEFSSSITTLFTSDFIPVCPATDDIIITNPLNAGNYANVIYFNENKEMIGMYKFTVMKAYEGLYIRPILYNDVAYIKFSAPITDLHNCRVTADGTPNFGSGVYPDTAGFNNVILITRRAKVIKCGTKTYTGKACYKILKDCITNDKPIYDSETVSGQLIPLRAHSYERTDSTTTTCRFIGNKINGDSVTLVVTLGDSGTVNLS